MALTAKERDLVRDAMALVIRETYKGERIILQGIGTFAVKHSKERLARNPKTGENVLVPAKQKLTFKSSVKA